MSRRIGFILTILFFLFSCVIIPLSWSHSGRTDSAGGHYNRKTGEYHYHSKPAPQSSITPSSKSDPAKQDSEKKQGIVYVTNTGKKYHSEGCRYLRYSKIPINIKKARDLGYTACKVCKGVPTKTKQE